MEKIAYSGLNFKPMYVLTDFAISLILCLVITYFHSYIVYILFTCFTVDSKIHENRCKKKHVDLPGTFVLGTLYRYTSFTAVYDVINRTRRRTQMGELVEIVANTPKFNFI